MLNPIISLNYGLANVHLSPAPRGFVAETYYVDSDSGRYFAKILKSPLDIQSVLASLPVLHELHQMGIEQITYPILTRDGQFSISLDNRLLVLFNYIEGDWIFDFPFEPYVELLARIHQLSDQIQTPLPHETYDLWFMDDLHAFCQKLWNGSFDHPQEQRTAQWAVERQPVIQHAIMTIQDTAARLQTSHRPFILTHGDAAGNILYDGKQVYLVDWDAIIFAPPERDTWFHRHQHHFLPVYRQFMPDYQFDPTAYRFYLYKRYLEDAVGYFDKILSSESSDAGKKQNFHELVETCDEWLFPLMEKA
ncbi:MAG: phosphotransferase [Anaerolineae bacterium]|nr:phosphotransferase [Anaerolineae bacterium]